ncbi:hypothetical protein CPT_Seuss7 [Caulobacter phage Seuss]|uniref:Uncharacterized protein n=1 Tax=Caulobacter phage Seuss TaxID=1675601 RepID=A0A0K1LMV3_9CAUD|nr:hypothetical protein HOR08_gp007 [Caulobacter phage Seuss]AKU43533.1 hypothetical protein CPT_Seuss7 [Caulobacter phage Seuss]
MNDMTSPPSGGKPFYPPLTDVQLTPFRALVAQFEKFPDILDRPECPYDHGVKVMIRRLLMADKVNGGSRDEIEIDGLVDASADAIDREIAALLLQVKRDSSVYAGSDPKDKMAFMKGSHDLLSKLVDLQTKRFNVRNMAKMQRLVIEHLEEFLTPAQRTTLITKLKDLIDA